MFMRSCLDLISKQVFLPRPLTVATSAWYSTSPSIPTPPKRGKTAWVLYFSEHWPLLVKENPDIFKKLSDNWHKLDKSVLEKYQQISEESKKKYQEEIEVYKANLSSDDKLAIAKHKATLKKEKKDKTKINQKKHLKALGMPKRPRNAYIIFQMDYAKKNYESGYQAIKESAKIAAVWAQLPEKEKSKWLELAAEEEKEYKRHLQEWESRMIAEGNIEIIHTKSKSK
ncbi:hypothetical protein FOCC_FOCC004464 [Frankliniella occidentalis]|nr:hypothetical protein FOCC_FOCC004464 [Frankliniella occidentalis]